MISSTRGAGGRRRGCGRPEEGGKGAECRERGAERVPHHGHGFVERVAPGRDTSSDWRHQSERNLSAQPALNKVPPALRCWSARASQHCTKGWGPLPRWKLDNGGDVVHGANEAQIRQGAIDGHQRRQGAEEEAGRERSRRSSICSRVCRSAR